MHSIHHSFDISLAALYSIPEALLIAHFQHWIRLNRSKNQNIIDGRCWTYQTLEQLSFYMPYLTQRQIRYACEKLIKRGVLLKGNYNKMPMDHTIWYAFTNEESFGVGLNSNPPLKKEEKQEADEHDDLTNLQTPSPDLTNLSHRSDEIVSAIPDSKKLTYSKKLSSSPLPSSSFNATSQKTEEKRKEEALAAPLERRLASEKEEFLKELREELLGKESETEKIEVGLKWASHMFEILKKKSSPLGYAITVIEKESLQKLQSLTSPSFQKPPKKEIKGTQVERNWDWIAQNHQTAKNQIQGLKSSQRGYTVEMDEACIHFYFRACGKPGSYPIPFDTNPIDFESKLEEAKRWAAACNQNDDKRLFRKYNFQEAV